MTLRTPKDSAYRAGLESPAKAFSLLFVFFNKSRLE
jgi:hypothetical protein